MNHPLEKESSITAFFLTKVLCAYCQAIRRKKFDMQLDLQQRVASRPYGYNLPVRDELTK